MGAWSKDKVQLASVLHTKGLFVLSWKTPLFHSLSKDLLRMTDEVMRIPS